MRRLIFAALRSVINTLSYFLKETETENGKIFYKYREHMDYAKKIEMQERFWRCYATAPIKINAAPYVKLYAYKNGMQLTVKRDARSKYDMYTLKNSKGTVVFSLITDKLP